MKDLKIVVWVASGVIILWAINWIGAKWYYGCDTTGSGTFGDMFGATNALFSGLTIVGLIYTIILQRQEIKDTKKGSDDQLRVAKYQRFDSNFFNYLGLHRNIYEDIKDSFSNFEEGMIKPNTDPKEPLRAMMDTYQNSIQDQHVIKNFGNYLNTFNVVVEFIVSSKENTRDKYLATYFGQFHVTEKKLLWYHFSMGTTKPPHWELIKNLVFIGLKKSHIENVIARNSGLPGLED